jgi:hypothetical protein
VTDQQRAIEVLIPIAGVPAAPDIHEAASLWLMPENEAPPHDNTGHGGRATIDTHMTTAAPAPTQEEVQPMNDGHGDSDPQHPGADLDELHYLLGQYARQLFDAQKQRIMASNRVDAMIRDDREREAEPMREMVKQYEAIERGCERVLAHTARQHFMRDWVEAQRGIGLPGFARILGVTGSLDRFATVSKLWKYLGLHVVNGHAPRREKGVPWTHTDCSFAHLLTCPPDCTTDHHPNCVPGGVGTAYAPQGRVICHQLGEAIVKVGAGGPYRAAYDQKKAYYEAEREDWSQARRHNAAMRYAVKCLIRDMWIEWHTRRGQPLSDSHRTYAAPITRESVLV